MKRKRWREKRRCLAVLLSLVMCVSILSGWGSNTVQAKMYEWDDCSANMYECASMEEFVQAIIDGRVTGTKDQKVPNGERETMIHGFTLPADGSILVAAVTEDSAADSICYEVYLSKYLATNSLAEIYAAPGGNLADSCTVFGRTDKQGAIYYVTGDRGAGHGLAEADSTVYVGFIPGGNVSTPKEGTVIDNLTGSGGNGTGDNGTGGNGTGTTVTEDVVLNSPKIEEDEEMSKSKQNVTYDCIYFGTYPQAQVVTKEMSRNYPYLSSVSQWANWLHDEDLVEDDALYRKLETTADWTNNRTVIDGVTYTRVTSADADFIYDDEEMNWDWTTESHFFSWPKNEDGSLDTNTWLYFKHEPIKWRIMELYQVEDGEGNKHKGATLSADRVLDSKQFNTVKEAVTWENSSLRAWLNDASDKGFMGTAFTDTEIENALLLMDTPNLGTGFDHQDLEGQDTEDQVYLFSEEDLYGDNAASYGFLQAVANKNDDGTISYYSFPADEAKQRRNSLYATAMGTQNDAAMYWSAPIRNVKWWTRSTGSYAESATRLNQEGGVDNSNVASHSIGVCPVVNINLDETSAWSYAGKVSTKDPYPEKTNTYTPAANTSVYHNPVVGDDEDTNSKQKVAYDTVTFGSYPQAEVVTSAAYEDYYFYVSKSSLNEGDVIVDDALHEKLEKADWKNNEAVVDGEKYRRIRSTDAVAAYHTDSQHQYLWSYQEGSTELIDKEAWHYFKYEPIRWRILSIEGQKALLFADKVLDTQLYNLNAGEDLTEEKNINQTEDPAGLLANSLNWSNSTVRSWLNGYGSTENRENTDYTDKGFVDSAFTDEEQAAIVPEALKYLDVVYRYGGSVWDGGEYMVADPWYLHPVSDKVFFLSYADVWKPLSYRYLFKANYSYGKISRHADYGFAGKNGMWGGISTDEALIGGSSTYAKAMGGSYGDKGANWYLLDAGTKQNVYSIWYNGSVNEGTACNDTSSGSMCGIRPALYLDLSKNKVYQDAGLYCTNAPVKDAFERIEAESYEKAGAGVWPSRRSTRVEDLKNGYSLLFKNVNFTEAAKSFLMNAACGAENVGTVTLRLDSEDGEVIGTCSVSNTGDWDTMQDFTCNVKETSGLHDLWLVFTYVVENKNIANVDYIMFGKEKVSGSSGGNETNESGNSGGTGTNESGSNGGNGTNESGSNGGSGTNESSSSGTGTTESGNSGGNGTGSTPGTGEATVTGNGEVGATVTTPDQEYTVTETAGSGKSGKVKWSKNKKTGTLTSVTIPQTVEVNGNSYEVTEIGDGAMEGDNTVTQVSIPETVKKIGKNAFKKCGSLTSVTIPQQVEKVDNSAFTDCTSLNKVNFTGDSVKEIGDDAFSGCTALKQVTLPKKVTKIGNNAFKKCESLTSVTIPKTVTSVGAGAYADCKSLTKVTYKGDKVTEVANDTFKGCTKLKTLVLPKKVKKIGKNAFLNCKSLKTLTIKSTSLKSIGKNAFKGTSKKLVVKVPAKKKAAYKKMLKKAGFKGKIK